MAPGIVRAKRALTPTRGSWAKGVVLFVALATLPACYHYVPVEADGPERGDPIRALVPPTSVEIGDIAVRDVTSVDGEYIAVTDELLRLSATWLQTSSGREFDGLHYTVELERINLEQVLAKRLDTRKTLLVGAGVALGAYLLQAVISEGGSSGDPPGGGGGDPK